MCFGVGGLGFGFVLVIWVDVWVWVLLVMFGWLFRFDCGFNLLDVGFVYTVLSWVVGLFGCFCFSCGYFVLFIWGLLVVVGLLVVFSVCLYVFARVLAFCFYLFFIITFVSCWLVGLCLFGFCVVVGGFWFGIGLLVFVCV